MRGFLEATTPPEAPAQTPQQPPPPHSEALLSVSPPWGPGTKLQPVSECPLAGTARLGPLFAQEPHPAAPLPTPGPRPLTSEAGEHPPEQDPWPLAQEGREGEPPPAYKRGSSPRNRVGKGPGPAFTPHQPQLLGGQAAHGRRCLTLSKAASRGRPRPSPSGEGGSCQCSHPTRPHPRTCRPLTGPSPLTPLSTAHPPRGSSSWFSSHSSPPEPAVTLQTHTAHTRMGPGPGVPEPECEPRRQARPPAGQQALNQREAPRATPRLYQPGPPGPCEPPLTTDTPREGTHTRDQTWPPPCWLWASRQGQ